MLHRDKGGAAETYDLLLSASVNHDARLQLSDLDTSLSYSSGTVVMMCERALLHEVHEWEKGERICLAHYVHDNVHQRLGLPRPGWVEQENYTQLMSLDYA